TGDSWQERQQTSNVDTESTDQFGSVVALSGDTLVVGASRARVNGTDQGAAYIFTRNHGAAENWGQVVKLIASDGGSFDFFGSAVAISDDTVVVGAYNKNSGVIPGTAYIFERNQGGANKWGEVTILTASDGAANDQFGRSVAISGDTLIVGASSSDINDNNNQGAAYVFERNQGGADAWGEVVKLTASDGASNNQFGIAVAMDGDTAIVGSVATIDVNTAQGAAYIFERNQGGTDNWGEVIKLVASDGAADDFFGTAVALSGDTLVVGAYGVDRSTSDQGAAYIYQYNQGGTNNWDEVTKLISNDSGFNDRFGSAVAINGDNVVIGAANQPGQAQQGSVYLFHRNHGGLDAWGEVAQPSIHNAATSDIFGRAVALSDDTLVSGLSRAVAIFRLEQTPLARDDRVATPENTSVDIPVIANDSPAGGEVLSVQQPVSGLATIKGRTTILSGQPDTTTTIEYTPPLGETGSFTFTYRLDTGQRSDTATVTVDVGQINDTAAITLTRPLSTTQVTEGGSDDSYTLVLGSEPTAPVSISLTTDEQLLVTPTLLVFTPQNWNTPQAVSISAVDDQRIERDHTGTITQTVTSDDSAYNGFALAPVTVAIRDNDQAGVVFIQPDGRLYPVEGGDPRSYQVRLAAEPTSNVVVVVRPAGLLQANPGSLTFTPLNWDQPQLITLQLGDNGSIDGNQTVLLPHSVVSADPDFDGLAVPALPVVSVDPTPSLADVGEQEPNDNLADGEVNPIGPPAADDVSTWFVTVTGRISSTTISIGSPLMWYSLVRPWCSPSPTCPMIMIWSLAPLTRCPLMIRLPTG
ncbi:MAG: hypothetical protein HC837_20200, partial [Chloroflexaceae bacterium]|nr:hypothetical protein [Chloroflexaceae bacterium]